MHSDTALSLFFAVALLFMGLMFLVGLFHRAAIDPDDIFFPVVRDKRTLKAGDQIAFDSCIVLALFMLLDTFAFHASSSVPSVRAFFVLVGVILSWLIRLIFIAIYKNKDYEHVPRVWPFSRIT